MQMLSCEHAEVSTFQVRWRWSEGNVAMWGNRCTLHFAAGEYGRNRRIMRRATWKGKSPYDDTGMFCVIIGLQLSPWLPGERRPVADCCDRSPA